MKAEDLYNWRRANDPHFEEIRELMAEEAVELPDEQGSVFNSDHRMFNVAYEKIRLERYPNEGDPSTIARARGNDDVYAMEELARQLGLGNLEYDGPDKN